MYTAAESLLRHIETNFDHDPPFKTVDVFASEIDANGAIKLTKAVPAVYYMFKQARLVTRANGSINGVLLVITSSTALDPKTKKRASLSQAAALARWLLLDANRTFASTEGQRYELDNVIEIELYGITAQYTAVLLGVTINQRR